MYEHLRSSSVSAPRTHKQSFCTTIEWPHERSAKPIKSESREPITRELGHADHDLKAVQERHDLLKQRFTVRLKSEAIRLRSMWRLNSMNVCTTLYSLQYKVRLYKLGYDHTRDTHLTYKTHPAVLCPGRLDLSVFIGPIRSFGIIRRLHGRTGLRPRKLLTTTHLG